MPPAVCCADVELVIQTEPPKDYETYIHRSGRTGRAGSTGVCITLCSRNKEDRVPYIERKAGFEFERIGAPQPAEMAQVAARRAVETIASVDDSVVPWFQAAAKSLLETSASPEAALAKALAKLTGAVSTPVLSPPTVVRHDCEAAIQCCSTCSPGSVERSDMHGAA
jgi:ATP-dependent RNA helicase DDX21